MITKSLIRVTIPTIRLTSKLTDQLDSNDDHSSKRYSISVKRVNISPFHVTRYEFSSATPK